MRAHTILVLTGAASVASCRDAVEPIRVVHPPLAALALSDFFGVSSPSGFVAVIAALPPSTPVLGADERVEVRISTSNGDVEVIQLERQYCSARPHSCTLISVSMKDGCNIAQLHGFSDRDARWWISCPSGNCGALRVFDSHSVQSILRSLKGHPATLNAELATSGSLPGEAPDADYARSLFDAIPIRVGPAIPFDAILQGSPGDDVTVEYRQPDGSETRVSGAFLDGS